MSSMTNVSTALPKKEKATKYKDMNQLLQGLTCLAYTTHIRLSMCYSTPMDCDSSIFTDNATLVMHGYKFWPKVFSASAYEFCCHQVADPCYWPIRIL